MSSSNGFHHDETIPVAERSSISGLVDFLASKNYRFLCPTPETHSCYLTSRKGPQTRASSLTDIFGWSLPVERSLLEELLPESLDIDSIFERVDASCDLLKATIRVTSLNFNGPVYSYPRNEERKTSLDLYVHSAFPCRGSGRGGVFCGPDTYRYLSYLASPSVKELIEESCRTVKTSGNGTATAVDLGCGPGAGALGLHRQYGHIFSSVQGLDINPYAIAFSEVNAKLIETKYHKAGAKTENGASVADLTFKQSSFLSAIEGIQDLALVISDPPYIATATATGVYCDGGDDGMAFAIDLIDRSLQLLAPGGLVIMHTGVSVPGDAPESDKLLEQCQQLEKQGKADILQYVLIDNDVFGNEVGQDPQNRLADKPFYQYYDSEDPVRGARFSKGMAGSLDNGTYGMPVELVYSFEKLGKAATIVDVGGGRGQNCIRLANLFPEMSFVLQDLYVNANSESLLHVPVDIRNRIKWQVHDFYDSQPVKGADLYLISQILMDHQFDACRVIMQHIVEAMNPNHSVLLISDYMSPGEEDYLSPTINALKIHIMSILGLRDNGGVPATIGILNGQARVGMSAEELTELASCSENGTVLKVSRRDLGYICGLGMAGKRLHGGTTISATMALAHLAGIRIIGTSGLGGVHRGAESSMDISADLTELGRTPITVISSGCKSFLDIPRTLEYLETQGVCVATFADDRAGAVDFPAFFTRDSGVKSPQTICDEAEAAGIIYAQSHLPLSSGIHFANPISAEYSIPKTEMDAIIEEAIRLAEDEGYQGSDNTPFVLAKIKQLKGEESLRANRAIIEANVKCATRVAVELAKLEQSLANEAN
ncbi:Pseudouridine-5'-phosphate glycosidase [Drechslerella dactyloides]|uniref:Pseudouridine-5'-phosphate glycosidase n=1 Tax=Drechslerella dactyloides TaxID=74499 RepID=A0AAD6ISN1_DREDA|nr:Pseudouridine-5'-phosphate glycosidase [Drechslerella dactyloides]